MHPQNQKGKEVHTENVTKDTHGKPYKQLFPHFFE